MLSQLLALCWQQSRVLRSADGQCAQKRPERERRNCDLINLGSLSLQFPDLIGSPLDAVSSPKTVNRILSSIRSLTSISDFSTTNDNFMTKHGSCCIGDRLSPQVKHITDSVDGIELEAVASVAPPQKPAQLTQLYELLKQSDIISDQAPCFEVVMRLTAVPTQPDYWRRLNIQSYATSDTRFAWCPKIICNYCPGFEYSLFQHYFHKEITEVPLKWHSSTYLHRVRVKRGRRESPRRSSLDAALET